MPYSKMVLNGFNPCSNGLSAQRQPVKVYAGMPIGVSILVLMDFRLKDIPINIFAAGDTGFNPCSNGLSAQSHRAF